MRMMIEFQIPYEQMLSYSYIDEQEAWDKI